MPSPEGAETSHVISCIPGLRILAINKKHLLYPFQSDISVFDYHRWADMNLHANKSFQFPFAFIIIDYLTHKYTVDIVAQVIPFCDDMQCVPIFLLYLFL